MSVDVDVVYYFCYKQKTAYDVRISDWSSDVCSSDLGVVGLAGQGGRRHQRGGAKDGSERHPGSELRQAPRQSVILDHIYLPRFVGLLRIPNTSSHCIASRYLISNQR